MLFTTLIDLGGPLGWLAMLTPFAVLGVMLIWALFDRPSPRQQGHLEEEPKVAVAAADAARVSEAPRAPPSREPPVSTATPGAVLVPTPPPSPPSPPMSAPVPPPQAAAPAPSPPPAPQPTPPPQPAPARPAAAAPPELSASDEVARIERAIRSALAQSDEAGVARLSLELAHALPPGQEQGHDVEGYLRRSILIAMRLGDTRTHAAARLELGDRVGARGDMITACEHWQIARQIFWDGNEASGLAEADRRMIANGCPTDWVLNDF